MRLQSLAFVLSNFSCTCLFLQLISHLVFLALAVCPSTRPSGTLLPVRIRPSASNFCVPTTTLFRSNSVYMWSSRLRFRSCSEHREQTGTDNTGSTNEAAKGTNQQFYLCHFLVSFERSIARAFPRMSLTYILAACLNTSQPHPAACACARPSGIPLLHCNNQYIPLSLCNFVILYPPVLVLQGAMQGP